MICLQLFHKFTKLTLNKSVLSKTNGRADGGRLKSLGGGGGGGGRKERRKEYSEKLRPFFVRWQPIRFFGLHDSRDSGWMIFETNSFNSTTVPQDV